MSEFTKFGTKADLPTDGEARELTAGEVTICVANVDGEYCAMQNTCPHEGGSLGQGYVSLGKVVCPWHGWMVDPKTGQVAQDSRVKIPIYPMRVEGDEILVQVD